jgi:hypothetical protein
MPAIAGLCVFIGIGFLIVGTWRNGQRARRDQ